MTKTIAYITPVKFREESAAKQRILGNIEALHRENYDVMVIDGGEKNETFSINNCKVYSVEERIVKNRGIAGKIYSSFAMGKKTLRFLKTNQTKIDIIVIYSGYSPYLIRLLKYCKSHNIKIVFDCVEWYQPKKTWEYIYNPYYWNIEISMRYLIPKCDGVISISRYLYKYYSSRNIKSVLIPPLISCNKYTKVGEYIPDGKGKIKLVYAGNPGHKDLLETVVRTVNEMSESFELYVVGVEGINSENIKYFGWVPLAHAREIVNSAHFSVLLRPDNKTSHAGFSTKVVESMSLGVPVIANDTSDLSAYIKDGENGYLFKGGSTEFRRKLIEVKNCMNNNLYQNLSANSLKSFMVNFSSESKKNELEEFFSHL
ncbi:glycosyltransferase [Vibrio breoganii]